ncbi:thioredoxin domain-containing protein 5 homolog [Euwallacea similis]|uniref:thioredoxin domain-containing protein 5 homolog n=1 Tax=Euwallacea similis TaxID=1736056 RepID=UPI00344E2CE5
MFILNIYLFLMVSFLVPHITGHEDIHTFKYTEDNFADSISQKNHFIMFYAPWCGHCQRLAPTWDQLAEMLNEEDTNIRVAKVDCTTDAKICSDQDVTGYPTLKFFKPGDNTGVKFRGTRDLPTLTNFINEQIRQDEDTPPGLVATKESPLKELNNDNFEKIIEKGKAFVKFYAPWCGHCQRLAPIWQDLAKAMEFNDEISIAKIDCTEFRAICTNHDVKGYPTLLWFENGQKIGKYSGDRSLDDLKNYINQMSGSEGSEKSDSKLTKETEDQPVVELNADAFSEEIKFGITFVDFYSPWCGHCKRLAPTWEQLGKKYQNEGVVKIGKVDCTVPDNREFCNEQEIDGFPSLFLYKDGQKISEYNGNRDLDDLSEFVNQHLGHDEL